MAVAVYYVIRGDDMVKIEFGTLTEYEGYSTPEIVNINDKLDMAIYNPLDKVEQPIVALIRKVEFDLAEPFLITKNTFWAIANELEKRGIV